MQQPSQTSCQLSRNRINPSLVGSEDRVQDATTGGGAHSLVDRTYSGRRTAKASRYWTPEHKILSSATDATSPTTSTINSNTAISLSPTTHSLLPIPPSSITFPSFTARAPPSLSSSSSSSTPSSASSASLSGPSSYSSTPPFEFSSDRVTQQQSIITSEEECQDHLDKEPLLLSGLSSERLLLHHPCRGQEEEGTSQAERIASPDQQQQPSPLQSQRPHHFQPQKQTMAEEQPLPQVPSHHSDRADCQSHSSNQSPRPQPIRRRSPTHCPLPPAAFPSISSSVHSTSSSSNLSSSSSSPLSCSAYSYLSPSSSPTSSTATDIDRLLQYTLSSPSLTSTAPRIITSSPISIHTSLQLPRLEQSPQSALSPSLSSLPFCGSPSSSGVFSTSFTAESTTSTSLSCAYSQPFLSVPSSDTPQSATATTLHRRTSTSILQTLDSLSPQPTSPNTMTRQRSQSASSAQQLAKSPRSPITASLTTTTPLYDSLQPPKTLQDILLLAQSHYISHRYVQALSLYKLAAEHHHSLPACSSLYALYTSNQTGSGLVRSDTKATLILIHALRIWMARRWSTTRIEPIGSMRSRTQDDHDELEEYFAQPRKPTRQLSRQQQKQLQQRRSLSTGATASFCPTKEQLMMAVPDNGNRALAHSMESEYRHPQFLNWRDDDAATEIRIESTGSEGESESSESDEDGSEGDDSDDEYEVDQVDLESDQEECDNDDDGDEDQEEEEEARRVGLATGEIEDIIQKICHMIQKGVLGLDEPVLIEAVSMLRKIERGLHQEAKAIKAERSKSIPLFASSLCGGPSDEARSSTLLLTQGIDLSFLDLDSPYNDPSGSPTQTQAQAQAQPMGRSIRQHPGRNFTSPTPLIHGPCLVSQLSKSTPVNASIAKMSTKEQETDQLFACAIRIRVMFTLGWVHQQKGEYHYGAQAYGVCSEIPATGKRLLDTLQHQANVQRWTCKAFEHKAQEQAEADRRRAVEAEVEDAKEGGHSTAVPVSIAESPIRIENNKKNRTPATRSPPSRNTIGSSASSIFTSSQPSTTGSRLHHLPDISSPSSLSTSESESASTATHGLSTSSSAVSSFSAAIWSSGLFKSNSKSSATSLPSKVPVGLKIQTVLEPPVSIETKDDPIRGRTSKADSKHKHHRQHSNQTKRQQQQQKGPKGGGTSNPTLTMTGHQNQIVKCGHCGQRRALLPLCVCKKVRYCNLECRLAHLETHRSTCSGLVSSSSSFVVSRSAEGGVMGIDDPNFSVGPLGVAL